MTIELTEKEIADIIVGLTLAMKQLDATGNYADKMLSDRLELIDEKLGRQ